MVICRFTVPSVVYDPMKDDDPVREDPMLVSDHLHDDDHPVFSQQGCRHKKAGEVYLYPQTLQGVMMTQRLVIGDPHRRKRKGSQ